MESKTVKILARELRDISDEYIQRTAMSVVGDILIELNLLAGGGHTESVKLYDLNSIEVHYLNELGFCVNKVEKEDGDFVGYKIMW